MYLEWIESIPSEVVHWIKRHANVEVECILEAHHIELSAITLASWNIKFDPSIERVDRLLTDH